MVLTIKQQRLVDYNNIIVANKNKFKSGTVIDRKTLIKMFKIADANYSSNAKYPEMQKANLKLVQAQNDLNILLRENGLYMKSQDYYSEFKIVEKDYTKKTVVRYSAEVDINNYCTTRLEANLARRVKNGTWGTYNKVPTQVIQNMGNNYNTPRHSQVIQRVKTI